LSKPTEYSGLSSTTHYRVHAVGHTDVGREREVNEDSMHVSSKLDYFLVFDGMGGHTSGQLASQMAVEHTRNGLAQFSDTPEVPSLARAIEHASNTIFAHADAHPKFRGMGTTAVAIRLSADTVQIAHVGDSRLYRLRNNQFTQETRDHSLTNLYQDKPQLIGRLGPATSNVIVRAVGLEARVSVEYRTCDMQEDDLYLLCCDGLTDLVSDTAIAHMLQGEESLQHKAKQLVAQANQNGGSDNITVILVHILGGNESNFDDEGKTSLGF